MGTRKNIISIEEYYHLYSRGVDKRIIFIDDNDRKRFIRLLFLCNGSKPVIYRTIQGVPLDKINVGDKLVAIGAYTLMPNHFHLLVKEITENGTVKFMSKLLTSYSMYFNKKYDRNGTLFGSEFKSEYLDSDEYLKYIFAYIHLNPVKIIYPKWRNGGESDHSQIKKFLTKYDFSSYKDYVSVKRESGIILNKSVFPDYCTNEVDFESYINEWINFDPESFQGLPLDVIPRGVLGYPQV